MNTQQKRVGELLVKRNVFLTGPAGTGKTYTVKEIEKEFKQNKKQVYITATTGIASRNYENGMTLHSFAGLPTTNTDIKIILNKLSPIVLDRLKSVDLLIIDEVSMLKGETLEIVHLLLQHAKSNQDLFGGVRVLLAGDFFQLPPIYKNEQIKLLFEHPFWKSAQFVTVQLTENYRQQNDNEFQQCLTDIREGDISRKTLNYLESRAQEEDTLKNNYLRVFFTNKETEGYNFRRIQEINHPPVYITSQIKTFNKYELPPDWPFQIPAYITLKIGARVMISKNLPDKDLVNGHIVKIREISSDNKIIVVSFQKRIIELSPVTEIIFDNKQQKLAECVGFPLILAYGLTVHRVQGLTLKHVVIYINSLQFTPHLFYVALSRVTEGKNLFIITKKLFLKQFINEIRIIKSVYHFYANNDNLIDMNHDKEFETKLLTI
ncbi:ATP-dependent DNA helicase pif1-like [Hydra vulgaris]|uniref:ATP-dependent DNA helicase n=1 Tax=Hydra vulgaris TaxID=6087 RepID=A0ABM4CKX3_HYDVU